MKKEGEDSCHSWVILAACSIINFVTSGLLYGPTGVLYVAYQDTTSSSAERASWVIALTPAMSIIGGPLGAILSTLMEVRTIIISGIVLGTVGTAAGYLSLNVYYLVVTYGLLNGIGTALASTALSALINNAFDKYRETAMGIFCSVTPIAGAVMPIFTQTLYDQFGLQGTFLILGGVYLQAMLGAMLFMDTRMKVLNLSRSSSQEVKPANEKSGHELQHLRAYEEVKQKEDKKPAENRNGHVKIPVEEVETQTVLVVELRKAQEAAKKSRALRNRVRTYSLTGKEKMTSILKEPGFHLSNFTLVIGNFLCLLFSLITVDNGIQNNLKVHHAVHLMTIYSGGQLFGRLALGWISDPKYVTKPAYFAVTHLIFSVVCVSFAFSKCFGVLGFLSALTGVILGNLNPLAKVVYSDYLRKDQMVIAMYMSYFMVGVLAVIRSAFVGQIRDAYGDYKNVYYFMGAISFMTAVVWTCEYFRKRRRKLCVIDEQ